MRLARGLAAAALAVTLLASGCWSRRELNDLAPALSLGVEAAANGQLEITITIAQSAGSPATGSGGSGGARARFQRVVVTRTAPTIADAIRKAQMTVPRRIALDHVGLILLVERLADSGVDSLLDFLLRNHEVRLTTRIAMVRGASPAELLPQVPLMRASQSDAIRELETARSNLTITLKDFFMARASGSISPIMPVVTMRPEVAREIGGSTGVGAAPRELELSGAAILRNDRLAAVLDYDELQGAMWLRDRPRDTFLTVPCPGTGNGVASARVNSSHRKIRPSLDGRNLSFAVDLSGAAHLMEVQCRLNVLNPADLRKLEEAFSREVTRMAMLAIRHSQSVRADPFLFGEQVRAAMPGLWRVTGGTRWGDTWSRAQVRVTSSIRLIHVETSSEVPPRINPAPGDPPDDVR